MKIKEAGANAKRKGQGRGKKEKKQQRKQGSANSSALISPHQCRNSYFPASYLLQPGVIVWFTDLTGSLLRSRMEEKFFLTACVGSVSSIFLPT
jgi:hypothetical protein